MGRTRKPSTPAPAKKAESAEPEALEETTAQDTDEQEDDAEDEDEDDTAKPAEPEYPPAPGGPKAKPLAVEEKRVKLPRRNLGGQYKCKTCVRKDGKKNSPGTILTLTDAEARHYLKFEAVEAID